MANLQVPEGFEITVFAEGLGNPCMMAVGADGTVYVTRRMNSDVVALRDAAEQHRARIEQCPAVATAQVEVTHG